MLLPKIERSDIWDQLTSPPRDTSGNALNVQIPPIETFVCPSDRDVTTQPDLAGLSYSANTGGWDLDGSGAFLYTTNPNKPQGDTLDNGVFFDLAQYDRLAASGVSIKGPKVRMSAINDGAGTTLMYAENIHKNYDPSSASPVSGSPPFSWLFGSEQQLGFVWVVPTGGTATSPVPGTGIGDQEALNRDSLGDLKFLPTSPRYARPASAHSSGMNVAFCDGHGEFLRDDIDYTVYQQLMTPNGRKCVDPADNKAGVNPINTNHSIYKFRNLAPLSEKDWH